MRQDAAVVDGLEARQQEGRPLEQAQVLWRRVLDLTDPIEQHGPFAGVIEVLSASRHDSTTLAHALALGRTQLRGEPNAIAVDRAVRRLERAIQFLGVRPTTNTAAMSGARDA